MQVTYYRPLGRRVSIFMNSCPYLEWIPKALLPLALYLRKSGGIPRGASDRFSLNTLTENEQADARRPNPSRETNFSGANGDKEICIFPVQLTTSRIGNLTRLIHTLLYVMITYGPGKVANPARGQLNREITIIFPCPRSRLGIWSRETDSAVPSRVSLLISILRLNLVLTYGIPPEFRGGVHELLCG